MAAPTATVTPIATDTDFAHYVTNFPASSLLVIYFHAPWAAPCKQMSTILEALASTYTLSTPPQIGFVSIDAEELPDISEQYDISQVPVIVLQKNGQVVDTVSGVDPAKVRAAIEQHAGPATAGAPNVLPPAQTVTRAAADNATAAPPPAAAPGEQKETTKEELFERLGNLVKAAPVMLFMKGTPSAPQCGFSRQTVQLLREKGIRYGFFNILADDEVRQGLKEFADWPTFPQLWVGGELVGGLDIVKEEFANDPTFLNEYSVNAQQRA